MEKEKVMLSVILPTIHVDKIYGLIESFLSSYTGEWEFIIVTPYKVPSNVISKWGNDRIKIIQDWGTPVRCQQRALLACSGEYVTRMVDDGLYHGGTLDVAMQKAKEGTVVNLKFTESNDSIDLTHKDCQQLTMAKDEFYFLQYHNQTLMPYAPANFQVINFAIYPREILNGIGGWDCQFESIAIAELDLSIRLQFFGIKIDITEGLILSCGWTPGLDGDHAPLHHAFYADMEIYKRIYSDISYENRILVNLNNWENSPAKWNRRFGE